MTLTGLPTMQPINNGLQKARIKPISAPSVAEPFVIGHQFKGAAWLTADHPIYLNA
jgi:hypothetical protein